jgi:hypothetical protein
VTASELALSKLLTDNGYRVLHNGWPDFYAVPRDGGPGFAVELKSSHGKLGEHQKELHEALAAAGVRVVVAKETQAGRRPLLEMTPAERIEFFQDIGRLGGSKGGKAAAKNMTPEERTARARAAAQKRWSKRRKKS